MLTSVRETCKVVPREITAFVAQSADASPGKLPVNVVSSLLAVVPPLLLLPELDLIFMKIMDQGRAVGAVSQIVLILQRVMCATPGSDRAPPIPPQALPHTLSLLAKMANARPVVRAASCFWI